MAERDRDTGGANGDRPYRPLTERVLGRLPGSSWVWIIAFAAVPWINAGINLLLGTERTSAVWEQSTAFIVANYAALSFATGFTFWASGRLTRLLEPIRRASPESAGEPFRGMNNARWPLVIAVGTDLVFGIVTFFQVGWEEAVIRGTTWLVIGIPLWTFVWTYASLLLGLNRVGRQRLVPDTLHVDPGLGVQALGRLAATGLWMMLIWLVPVLLTGLPDLAGFILGTLVLGGVLGVFFLSLAGLHGQMAEVKRSELAIARDLYAQAYRPVRETPNLETLEAQRSLLAAADALEKRANAIHEWPFDDATVTRVLTITTSVIAITIGRLILDPFGL